MCEDEEKIQSEAYTPIHSDYTKLPKDKVLGQIVYDLEHATRELETEDFPPLDIVNELVDIQVEYDYCLAQKFYLRMAECFAEEEAWVIDREFPLLGDSGFLLPCAYRDNVYNALGFAESTRPKDGCPYCPYDCGIVGCMYRNAFSPRVRIIRIKQVASHARWKFNVDIPNEEQFNFVCQHMKDYQKHWSIDFTWLTYEKAKLLWKKSYELLAYWPLKEGVKVKGELK